MNYFDKYSINKRNVPLKENESGTTVPRLPSLSKVRQESLSSPPGTRRGSFPITSLGKIKYHSAEPKGPQGTKPFKASKSQSDLPDPSHPVTREWRVSLLVGKATDTFGKLKSNKQTRKLSFGDIARAMTLRRSDSEKRRMCRMLKIKVETEKKRGSISQRRQSIDLHGDVCYAEDPRRIRQRALLGKFRRAGKLAIFCRRNFLQHCLRINAEEDELAPFIKQLHFHEDETPDLLIDLTKFKANRQLRIPDETKRILSKEVGERTKQEIYSVQIALRNIKSIAEYPNKMQARIAEVGLYEKYESKRVLVRQGHPASAFYFILSGAVVVMVMDMESKYARPVAHLYKGQTFGELAIINRSKRNSTVIAKETCEFLSISVQDYHKIFMSGGVKNIGDPDQDVFLKSLSCLTDWPVHLIQDYPSKCQFLFFKRDEILTKDSRFSDWLIIVKSGSLEVLKQLKKVAAFEWKKKKKPYLISGMEKKEFILRRNEVRRIVPELGIPVKTGDIEVESVTQLSNGHPAPFSHPGDNVTTRSNTSSSQLPNLWPFSVDLSDMEDTKFLDDAARYQELRYYKPQSQQKGRPEATSQQKNNLLEIVRKRDRSKSIIEEEDKELLGFQPHIRTIIEDLDAGNTSKDEYEDEKEANPEFVHVQTLTKGQVFGLADLFLEDQPSFSVVSKGADCILLNKQFYMEHASEKLVRDMRQELCPYPTEKELQERLQTSVDWAVYRRDILRHTLETLAVRREMRVSRNGTKVQEAFC